MLLTYNIDKPTKKQEEYRKQQSACFSPIQYYWANFNPRTFRKDDSRKGIMFCRNKSGKFFPVPLRDWRRSREERRNMAFYWSKCVQVVLEELPSNYNVYRGNFQLPSGVAVDDWRLFKKRLNRYIRDWCKKEDVEFQFVACQHITIRGNRDEMHFDFLAYSNTDKSMKRLRKLVIVHAFRRSRAMGRVGC